MRAFKARRGVGVCVAACVAMSLLAVMATGAEATQPTCLIVNLRADQSYGTLQEAVNAATAGDTLRVKGTCYGDTTVSKSLTIVGRGWATLNGGNTGSVVIVNEGVTAAIKGLTITGGSGSPAPSNTLHGEIVGGGIYNNNGSLTITNSTVSGNTAEYGGGILNNEGSLTLTNSTVGGNTAACPTRPPHPICIVEGGGIYNFEASLTLTNSTVSGNTASNGDKSGNGGGILDFSGSVTLTNSAVTGNTSKCARRRDPRSVRRSDPLTKSTVAGNTAANGGGIFGITEEGTFHTESITLNNSTVRGNTAIGSPRFTPPVPANGGGITDYESSVTLNGSSSVSRNTVSGDGGGIYGQDERCSVTLNNSSAMSRNTASGDGGGIYNGRKCSTLLNGSSSVSRNTASGDGGGIYNKEDEGATISFGIGWTGAVSRNIPDDIFND